MRSFLPLLVLVFFPITRLQSQPATPVPRLLGIVNLPERKSALLEIAGPGGGRSQFTFLSEGHRLADVEVLRINPELGTVEFRVARTNVVVASLGGTNPSASGAISIMLTNAGLIPVLHLYADCAGRTLLRHPGLPDRSFRIRAAPADRAEAAMIFEQALAAQGVATIRDGEKFVRVVPEAYAERERVSVAESKPAGDSAGPPFFKTGEMVFNGAELGMLARSYYAGVQDRQLVDVDAAWFRGPAKAPVFFSNQTLLSRAEVIHAFDILFAWHGVKFELVGDKFIKPVPLRSK